ncbi:MAG: hypothetical protein ABIM50_09300 [Novosphingobium sp.]
MKKPIVLLLAASLAATLAGCGKGATGPEAAAGASATSKPNPWSIGGSPTPSTSATPAAAPKPSGSAVPKANPWGLTSPSPSAKPS